MKYLIFTIPFLLLGCSDDSALRQAHDNLKNVQFDLDQCLSRQRMNQQDSGGFNNPEPEQTQQPEEPTCEDVVYTTIYKDGKLLATCDKVEQTSCGVHAENCLDKYEYECLTNVKTGSDTRKECK